MSGMSAPTFIVTADGVRLATYEWGNPAGPALVLVHGFAQCHLCFAPQFESALARDFRIVAYDLRGHGASDKPPTPRPTREARSGRRTSPPSWRPRSSSGPCWSAGRWAGRIIRQYLMNYGDAAIAGLNFVASLVIEDPRCRGPAGPKPPTPGQPLAEQIAGGDRLSRRLLRHQAVRKRVPGGARLQHAGPRPRASGDCGMVDRSGRDHRRPEATCACRRLSRTAARTRSCCRGGGDDRRRHRRRARSPGSTTAAIRRSARTRPASTPNSPAFMADPSMTRR